MKKGFTLVEILVAVMIVTLLVTAAVPIYERTVEKSRIAEARMMLKKIYESKMRIMDAMDLNTFNNNFGFQNLDMNMACEGNTSCTGATANTKDFTYYLKPTNGNANGVCAARRKGDNKGVNLLFLGEEVTTQKLLCNNGGSGGSCDAYGMNSQGSTYCTPK